MERSDGIDRRGFLAGAAALMGAGLIGSETEADSSDPQEIGRKFFAEARSWKQMFSRELTGRSVEELQEIMTNVRASLLRNWEEEHSYITGFRSAMWQELSDRHLVRENVEDWYHWVTEEDDLTWRKILSRIRVLPRELQKIAEYQCRQKAEAHALIGRIMGGLLEWHEGLHPIIDTSPTEGKVREVLDVSSKQRHS